eukprot:1058239-Amphidinium_carterae.1
MLMQSSTLNGEESLEWLNMAFGAAWYPMQDAFNASGNMTGIGSELAESIARDYASCSSDLATFCVERVVFGDEPPRLQAARIPDSHTADVLLKSLLKARYELNGNVTKNHSLPRIVLLEADLTWFTSPDFEVAICVKTSPVRSFLPQFCVKLSQMVFGPVAVAIALEAAPRGYPYMELLAITFVQVPPIDFSLVPVNAVSSAVTSLPLVREVIKSMITASLPILGEEQALTYDMGQYLYPSVKAAEAEAQRAAATQVRRNHLGTTPGLSP